MSRDKGEVAAAIVVTKKPEDYGVIPHAFIYLRGMLKNLVILGSSLHIFSIILGALKLYLITKV